MSQIKIKVNEVKSINSELRPNYTKISNIKSDLYAEVYRIDYRITSRRNIGYRLNRAASAAESIEAKLIRMESFIDTAMDRYNTAENNISRAAQAIKSIEKSDNGTSSDSKTKHTSSLLGSFIKELGKAKDDVEGFFSKAEKNAEDEIKHHGMDDIKKFGKLLWDTSPVGSTVNAVKWIANYLDEHPKITAVLTIIGGVILCVGAVLALPEILVGVATVSLASVIGAAVLGGLCIAFGSSDYSQADNEERELNDMKHKKSNYGKTDNELMGIIKDKEENDTKEDLNPIRKSIREGLSNLVGDKTGGKIGKNLYDVGDFTTTIASAVIDPGELAGAMSKSAKFIKTGEALMDTMKDGSKVGKFGEFTTGIKSFFSGKYEGILNGDMNIFKGINSWKDVPEALVKAKNSFSDLSKIPESIKLDNLNKIGVSEHIGASLKESYDVIHSSINSESSKDIFELINISKDYVYDTFQKSVYDSKTLWNILEASSNAKGVVDVGGNLYKPLAFINDVIGLKNSDTWSEIKKALSH